MASIYFNAEYIPFVLLTVQMLSRRIKRLIMVGQSAVDYNSSPIMPMTGAAVQHLKNGPQVPDRLLMLVTGQTHLQTQTFSRCRQYRQDDFERLLSAAISTGR